MRDGSVTLAFRRWKKQDVEPGRRFTTAAGMVRVEAVDARRRRRDHRRGGPAGRLARRRPAAQAAEPRRVAADVPRRGWSWDGEDPRIALREDADADATTTSPALDARLERLDRASPYGAWTMATLALIREHPQRRAPDLAEMVGRETAPFKLDVRKLKALGLTRSFAVGYEISPRGQAYLDRTTPEPAPPDPIGWDSGRTRGHRGGLAYRRTMPTLLVRAGPARGTAARPGRVRRRTTRRRRRRRGLRRSRTTRRYEPQTTCHPKPRAGTVVLGEWLVATLRRRRRRHRPCLRRRRLRAQGRPRGRLDARRRPPRRTGRSRKAFLDDGVRDRRGRQRPRPGPADGDHVRHLERPDVLRPGTSSSPRRTSRRAASRRRSAPRRSGTATTCTSRCRWPAPRGGPAGTRVASSRPTRLDAGRSAPRPAPSRGSGRPTPGPRCRCG